MTNRVSLAWFLGFFLIALNLGCSARKSLVMTEGSVPNIENNDDLFDDLSPPPPTDTSPASPQYIGVDGKALNLHCTVSLEESIRKTIEAMYNDFLKRGATKDEVDAWISFAFSQLGRNPNIRLALKEIANKFVLSTEWRELNIVTMYRYYLDHEPSRGEIDHMLGLWGQGRSVRWIEIQFLAGADYWNLNLATPSGFISALYREVLSREGSPSEVNSWVTQFNAGRTALQIANDFIDSQELHRNYVVGLYERLLHRIPSSQEMAGYVAEFGRERNLREELNAGFLSSFEFYEIHACR